VCKACHLATHFGYARVSGRDEVALAQLIAVTGLPRIQVAEQIDEAFDLWGRRSRRVWELDLSILTGVGVTVCRPERAADRPAAAARALQREHTRPMVGLHPPGEIVGLSNELNAEGESAR
jgi:hypothetical protein